MNKELIYNIIDNKIDKIVYHYNLTDNDCKTLISALKLCKSNNLTLDLSTINLIENSYENLYKLLNYLKNDNKIIKLNLSDCHINIFNEFNDNIHSIILNCISNLQNRTNNYNICYDQQINTHINNTISINNQINISKDNNLPENIIENIIYEVFKNNSTIHSLNVSNNSLILTNIILTSLINNKNNNLKSLGISINDDNYNNDTFKLLLILLEKNMLTSLKLSLLSIIFKYYTEFKSLLKSIENNTSLQKIKIIQIEERYYSHHDKYDIILLLLINSIIKNKNIKVLKYIKEQLELKFLTI